MPGDGDGSTTTQPSKEHQMQKKFEAPELLTPAEVAATFRVDGKTVARWAKSGKLHAIRTLGGHRRYQADEVRELLTRVEDGQR